jgi:hypothetical protein
MEHHANIQRLSKVVRGTVIKAETATVMILKKQSNPSARWDFKANSWSIGTSDEYQWFHEKSKEHSPWMNLDGALVWIQERDQKKNLNPQKSDPEKISFG